MTDERTFIENWWQRKFCMANLPTRDDVIMFAHALELLKAFRGAGDARWMTGPTEKSWLEAWWLRKYPGNPLKWGSVLSLDDAEELLIEFRKSAEVVCPKSMKRKNPHASALAKLGSKKTAGVRFEKISPKRRKEIARNAAVKRWAKFFERMGSEPPKKRTEGGKLRTDRSS